MEHKLKNQVSQINFVVFFSYTQLVTKNANQLRLNNNLKYLIFKRLDDDDKLSTFSRPAMLFELVKSVLK